MRALSPFETRAFVPRGPWPDLVGWAWSGCVRGRQQASLMVARSVRSYRSCLVDPPSSDESDTIMQVVRTGVTVDGCQDLVTGLPRGNFTLVQPRRLDLPFDSIRRPGCSCRIHRLRRAGFMHCLVESRWSGASGAGLKRRRRARRGGHWPVATDGRNRTPSSRDRVIDMDDASLTLLLSRASGVPTDASAPTPGFIHRFMATPRLIPPWRSGMSPLLDESAHVRLQASSHEGRATRPIHRTEASCRSCRREPGVDVAGFRSRAHGPAANGHRH